MSKIETKIRNRLLGAEAEVREAALSLNGIASTIMSGEEINLSLSNEEIFNRVKSHIVVLNQQATEIRELNQQISSSKAIVPL